MLARILRLLGRKPNACTGRADACDPSCPGWFVSHSDNHGHRVERCDDCARFECDYAANLHTYECPDCTREAAKQWKEVI